MSFTTATATFGYPGRKWSILTTYPWLYRPSKRDAEKFEELIENPPFAISHAAFEIGDNNSKNCRTARAVGSIDKSIYLDDSINYDKDEPSQSRAKCLSEIAKTNKASKSSVSQRRSNEASNTSCSQFRSNTSQESTRSNLENQSINSCADFQTKYKQSRSIIDKRNLILVNKKIEFLAKNQENDLKEKAKKELPNYTKQTHCIACDKYRVRLKL